VVTALRLPLAAVNFVGPLAALPFSRSIVPSVAILAAGRVLGWLAHLVVCLSRYPFLSQFALRGGPLGPLLRYGGWTTITNVVGPAMVFLDRFLIGAMLPIAAVTHYVTPYEMVTKLLVVPGAILGAMFPAFAATFASDRARLAVLYERSLRAVVLATFPLALIVATLAHEILAIWIGPVLPAQSAVILQWLALGVFVNAVGQVPYAALQGAGRPDIIARLHVAELPLYAAAIWLLASRFGVVGVAMAWTLRVGLDTATLLFISQRRLTVSSGSLALLGSALMAGTIAAGTQLPATAIRVTFVLLIAAVFAPGVWRWLITEHERARVRAWVRSPTVPAPAADAGGGPST
jgi:O-antigen/teichoic acid export membrane protein